MTATQLWALVIALALDLVVLGVGVLVIVHQGANQIRHDLDKQWERKP